MEPQAEIRHGIMSRENERSFFIDQHDVKQSFLHHDMIRGPQAEKRHGAQQDFASKRSLTAGTVTCRLLSERLGVLCLLISMGCITDSGAASVDGLGFGHDTERAAEAGATRITTATTTENISLSLPKQHLRTHSIGGPTIDPSAPARVARRRGPLRDHAKLPKLARSPSQSGEHGRSVGQEERW